MIIHAIALRAGSPGSPALRVLRYSGTWNPGVEFRLEMTYLHTSTWETAAGLALLASVAGAAFWHFRRRRPNPEELEQARRKLLSKSGRLVDGMLQDMCAMESGDGRTLTMLVYNYRIGGVEYECSQDITAMRDVLDPAQVRAGFPCSVRYQPGSPQNSIVVAEEWSGLRASQPAGTGPHPRFQSK